MDEGFGSILEALIFSPQSRALRDQRKERADQKSAIDALLTRLGVDPGLRDIAKLSPALTSTVTGIHEKTKKDASDANLLNRVGSFLGSGDAPRAAPSGDAPRAAPSGDAPRAAPSGDAPRAAPSGDDPGQSAASRINYLNSGKVRSQPLNENVAGWVNNAANQVGVFVDVVSGGQPGIGSGKPRVGSTRHDHGGAGDIKLFTMDGGKKRYLDMRNPDDQKKMGAFVSAARAYGATGIGAGEDYMGPHTLHVGGGKPSVWGAGGRGANAPEWLRTAYAAQQSAPQAAQQSAPQTAQPQGAMAKVLSLVSGKKDLDPWELAKDDPDLEQPANFFRLDRANWPRQGGQAPATAQAAPQAMAGGPSLPQSPAQRPPNTAPMAPMGQGQAPSPVGPGFNQLPMPGNMARLAGIQNQPSQPQEGSPSPYGTLQKSLAPMGQGQAPSPYGTLQKSLAPAQEGGLVDTKTPIADKTLAMVAQNGGTLPNNRTAPAYLTHGINEVGSQLEKTESQLAQVNKNLALLSATAGALNSPNASRAIRLQARVNELKYQREALLKKQGQLLATAGKNAEITPNMKEIAASGFVPGSPEYQKMVMRGIENKNIGQIPQGFRAVTNPNGDVVGLEPLPGSKQEEAANKRKSNEQTQAGIMVNVINDIEKTMSSSILKTTGSVGYFLSKIPGTAAADIGKNLDTLRANISFQKLAAMREASPTGGALGNVTVRELELLSNVIASLEQSQSKEQFERNLKIVKSTYQSLSDKARSIVDGTNTASPAGNPAASDSPAAGRSMPTNAKKAPDGNFYVPDPNRPGKFLRVDQ